MNASALPKWIRGSIGAVAVVLLVQLVSVTGLVPATVLPSIFNVLAGTGELLATPEFYVEIGSTLLAWFIGLAIASILGVAMGLVLGNFRPVYRAVSLVTELLRPIPSVALIPIAVLVWGNGLPMKVALVIFTAVWPVFFNTVYGVRDIDPVTWETTASFRLSKADALRRVLLPHAAPFAFTGIRIASSIALIVTITSEMFAASPQGIGSFVATIDVAGGSKAIVLGGAVVAGLIGVLIDRLLKYGESRLFAWKRATA